MSVASTQNAVVYLVDSAAGAAKSTAGARLAAGSYLVEVTTAAPRTTGSFTLTIDVSSGVAVKGLTDAEATPVLGATTATVTDGFTVVPADPDCEATTAGATVADGPGAAWTVSYAVPEGTTVNVEVRCTSGAHSATADADFTANDAPVDITGFENASQPAGDADSVEVSAGFDVIPAGADCRVTAPTDAAVTPATGGTRTVTLDVDAGEVETVTVRCDNGTQTDDATAEFTATDVGGCNSELGTFSDVGTTVSGTISSDDGCTSQRRSSGTYHARRHILRLDHPGWATVTLESAVPYPDGPDTYLLILAGDAVDGSGRRLEYNDDHRSGYDTHWRNSRIVDRFLHAGTYTIEATTYHSHDDARPGRTTGDYTLTVTVDHTPRATAQPVELRVENGNSITRTWTYEPGAATVAIASALPDGLAAAVTRYPGTTTSEIGRATLTATAARTGSYTIDITYTNGTEATHTATTIITADCPTGHTETSTRTCIPNSATLPTGCAPASLDVGFDWGRTIRNGLLGAYNSIAPVECVSLSHGRRAKYFEFSLSLPLPVQIDLSATKSSQPPSNMEFVSETAYLHLGPCCTRRVWVGGGC